MQALSKSLQVLVFVFASISILSFSACQPDDSRKPTPKYGSLTIKVVNLVDNKPLVLDSLSHKNAAGNEFAISRIQYYLSNFKFLGAECGDFTPADDYHLISMLHDPNIGDPNNDFYFERSTLEYEIPAGCYDKFEFGIGVDNVRNAEGPYNGDLDFSWNMNWSWSGNYIFIKNEGLYLDSLDEEQKYAFHIGDNDYYKNVMFEFDETFDIVEGQNYSITLYANLEEFFNSPNVIDLNKQNATMEPGPLQVLVSENYSDMFSFELE